MSAAPAVEHRSLPLGLAAVVVLREPDASTTPEDAEPLEDEEQRAARHRRRAAARARKAATSRRAAGPEPYDRDA